MAAILADPRDKAGFIRLHKQLIRHPLPLGSLFKKLRLIAHDPPIMRSSDPPNLRTSEGCLQGHF